MLAPQVRLLCPERRGASRYLSSGYMLGPWESAKEEEEEVQEGQGDYHRRSSRSLRPPFGGCCGPSFGTPSSASYHDFMTLTGIKVGHIRADGAGEFARSASFQAYCKRHNIVIEEVPSYTHTFNARAEGAIRICKDKVRAFLRRANMLRRFWPDALLHWCRTYAHWPDASGHTAWEKLHELGSHSLCHDLERDRHVFGSYVTGHLPREHPHVADTTHGDLAEEGVFLGNDLTHTHYTNILAPELQAQENHADE
jgi:hypothetical protein